jgi:hypothetical protein
MEFPLKFSKEIVRELEELEKENEGSDEDAITLALLRLGKEEDKEEWKKFSREIALMVLSEKFTPVLGLGRPRFVRGDITSVANGRTEALWECFYGLHTIESKDNWRVIKKAREGSLHSIPSETIIVCNRGEKVAYFGKSPQKYFPESEELFEELKCYEDYCPKECYLKDLLRKSKGILPIISRRKFYKITDIEELIIRLLEKELNEKAKDLTEKIYEDLLSRKDEILKTLKTPYVGVDTSQIPRSYQ